MPAPVETSYLRPAFLSALAAAATSLAIAAICVLLARGAGGLDVAELWRSVARTWLVAMGSGLHTGSTSISIAAVGAVIVCIGIVAWVVSWLVTERPQEPAAFAATSAGAYGVIAGIVSAASNTAGVSTSIVRSACVGFLVGGLGAIAGVICRHGESQRWWFTTAEEVRIAVRAAVPGVAAVLMASSVIVAGLLVLNVSQVGDLWALLDPGFGGGIVLALANVLAVPTLVLWTASALLGPGFAIGTGTSVDLTGAQLGQVPGFPLLGALPGPGEFPGWVFVLGLVPLLAGMLSGWRVEPGKHHTVAARMSLGASAGAIAGFVLGILVGTSGGAMGPGRMAEVGPPALTPLLVAVLVMAVGGAMGAALAHYRGGRASRSSVTRASGGPRLWKRHQSPSTD